MKKGQGECYRWDINEGVGVFNGGGVLVKNW